MADEKFIFTSEAKKKIFITIGTGVLLLIIGIVLLSLGGDHGHGGEHGAEHAAGHGEGHGSSVVYLRVLKDLWLNNVFFTGIAAVGIFFIAFNYIAQAGWATALKRVPESFGYYLFVGGPIMVILFLIGSHDLFHWTHGYLYEVNTPDFDPIIAGKKGYLNTFFFLFRTVLYFVLWIFIWWKLRMNSIAEDLDGNLKYHDNSIFWSAIFLIVWGVTSSTSAWDWVMSMDPHF